MPHAIRISLRGTQRCNPQRSSYAEITDRGFGGIRRRFYRINRLPPYVFAQVQSLKLAARQQGEDIIDFGMGNPDQPTPSHIVEKMIEAARKGKNHRYSASRGITKLRHAIAGWYKRNYDVDLDPETETIVTIGSKKG